jgi:hypothetical protein
MAITVTVQEVVNDVVLENTITTVNTTYDLVTISGDAADITVAATGTWAGGNLQNAIAHLANQLWKQASAPSGAQLSEGDLWYDTDDDELKVYRETSANVFEFVPLASATDTMDNLDGGQF